MEIFVNTYLGGVVAAAIIYLLVLLSRLDWSPPTTVLDWALFVVILAVAALLWPVVAALLGYVAYKEITEPLPVPPKDPKVVI